MAHPSKNKGNRFERYLVNRAITSGIDAKRAYASNGEALGHGPEVDCVIGGYRVQAKVRAKIASYLQIPEGCDVVSFRQTTGPIATREALVLIPYDMFLALLGGKALPVTSQGDNDVQEGTAGECTRPHDAGHDDRS